MSPRATSAPCANRLLALLPVAAQKRLIAQCEVVQLTESMVLCDRGDRIGHVHFPLDSFISLITPVGGHAGFEVGMVGLEGMHGISLALGIAIAPQRALVQGAGSALRVKAAAFRRELAISPSLRRLCDRYLYVLMAQLAQTGACTRFHLLDSRVARWLLMSHDRAPGDTFHLTQEFLGCMLGMRRVGITKAASALQKRDLISYKRGTITIRDRVGLEALACECYGNDRQAYDEVLGV